MGGEPKIGDLLDSRYRLTGHLGSGGMGSVYRAEHVAIRRPVAIKVLHPDFAGDPDHNKRFQREAFVTGRADHPNCVTVSDFGTLEGGSFYLVMELVDGTVLGDLLLRGRLPVRRALHIARHVLRGLAHAHAAGVVHRDVKPNNIILVQNGDDPDFAKLLDFGIAKLVDGAPAADAADQQITRIGTTVGTPTYVAPEQAVGGATDPRSDLYSLSIVLYEMIAGCPPFRAEDTVKLLGMHLSAPVPAMAELVPGLVVPPAVEELIRVGLAKERASRYPGAADYGAAIDDLLARDLENPAPAVPAPTVARPAMPSRRRIAAGAIAAAVALALVVILSARGGGEPPAPTRILAPLAPPAPPAPPAIDPSAAEDARAELDLAHERIDSHFPLEALEAYRRALALDPRLARDPTLRKNVEALARGRDPNLALMAVRVLGDAEADWARDELVELASRDRRNAIRRRARDLADKRGAGDRVDRLSSYGLDLVHGRTCEERAEAVPVLRDLGDKRAIAALERARSRKAGGILGIGARRVNGCMRAQLDEAIAHLEEL